MVEKRSLSEILEKLRGAFPTAEGKNGFVRKSRKAGLHSDADSAAEPVKILIKECEVGKKAPLCSRFGHKALLLCSVTSRCGHQPGAETPSSKVCFGSHGGVQNKGRSLIGFGEGNGESAHLYTLLRVRLSCLSL